MKRQSPDRTVHPFDTYFALPLIFGHAALSYSQDISRQWWRQFLRSPHHQHEEHAQLVVPEPLEADDERDLFA